MIKKKEKENKFTKIVKGIAEFFYSVILGCMFWGNMIMFAVMFFVLVNLQGYPTAQSMAGLMVLLMALNVILVLAMFFKGFKKSEVF